MAEKTVVVRLKAVVDDYQRAMKSAGDATASVAQKADNWKELGKSTADLGDRMTRNVTLPILAVGAAAAKMALDFDNAFTQMHTLAGVSAGEIGDLKDSVLDLAGETGRAPQELAEALLMIRSSGFEGAAALDVLEMSAKGAALSMGTTREVANAITNVLSGYGQANITAAQAMDILSASVEEGKTEASEMAPQFGRLIPVAAELGVSFGELGGIMAFLSKPTGDAALSATQLSGVLAKMLEPGIEGAEALDAVGMSAEDLRASILEKGLQATLEDLRSTLEANGMALNDFSVDQQFLQGALLLTGASAEDAREIIETVGDSAGKTDEAFGKWAESMGAQNSRAFADFQVALIRLGDLILPVASDVLEFAGKVAEAFSKLPEGAQKAILVFGLLAAATGPLLSVGGRLITVYGSVAKMIDNFGSNLANQAAAGFDQMGTAGGTAASGISRAARALGLLGVTVAALYAFGRALDAIDPRQTANISELERSLLDLADSGRVTGEMADIVGGDFGKLKEAIEGIASPSTATQLVNVGDEIGSLGGLLGDGVNDLEQYRQRVDDVDKALAGLAARNPEEAARVLEAITSELSADETERFLGVLDDYDTALAEIDTAARTAEGGIDATTGALGEQDEAALAAEEAIKGYLDALTAMFDPLFGMANALQSNQEAQIAVTEAQGALNAAIDEFGPNSAEAAAAQRDLDAAMLGAGSSALDVMSATAALNEEIMKNPGLLDQAKSSLGTWVAQGLITQSVADGIARQFDITAMTAVGLGRTDPRIDVTTSGVGQTVGELAWVAQAVNMIPRHVSINVGANVSAAAANIAAIARAAAGRQHGGRVTAHQPYIVGEVGEEVFVPDQSGTVIPHHLLGSMTPAAVGLGGGQQIVVSVSMAGAIVASSYDAERWVARAWNKAVRSPGQVNIKSDSLVRS